jgi:signal transduction histidine kinase
MSLRLLIRSRPWNFLIPLLLEVQSVLRNSHGPLMFSLTGLLFIPPRIARQVVPFLALGIGAVDFVYVSALLDSGRFAAGSGPAPVQSWPGNLLMPAAAAFTAVGVWLYFRLDAPGASWLVAAARGLRERAGVSSWPAVALVPVLVVGGELLLSGHGKPSLSPALTVMLGLVILAVGSLLVPRNPRAAVVLAIAVLPLIGLDGILVAWHWPEPSGFGLYGVVLVDDRSTAVVAGLQGGLLILAGVGLGGKFLQDSTGRRGAELAQRVATLTRTRADAVDSAAAELRRIERDLHDGAQARLVALGMNLRVAERTLKTDPDTALSLVSEAREASSRALTELRALVRGIYPPVLADRGLVDAIRALALDLPVPAVVQAALPGRPELAVASAVYFSAAEALTNVTRHAEASGVHIGIEHRGGMLRVEVTDNGVGGADPSLGTGLLGVERRLAAFDGILAVNSPAGGPTIVVIEVPCALS